MEHRRLIEASADILGELRDSLNESVGLAVLDRETAQGEILARAQGKTGIAVHFEVGYRFPLHCSAPGKALLAFLPEADREEVLGRLDFVELTPETITDPDALRADLQSAESAGYALDVSEAYPGCHCVGVPVLDVDGIAMAAIWTSAFATQLPRDRFRRVARQLRAAADRVAQRLQGGDIPQDAFSRAVIEEARAFFEGSLDQTLDLEGYARELGVSYSWFRAKFREHVGMSPKQYQLHLRADKAKSLLTHTDLSIKEIALQLGHDSQNYFSRTFRKREGLSPSEYREKHAKP